MTWPNALADTNAGRHTPYTQRPHWHISLLYSFFLIKTVLALWPKLLFYFAAFSKHEGAADGLYGIDNISACMCVCFLGGGLYFFDMMLWFTRLSRHSLTCLRTDIVHSHTDWDEDFIRGLSHQLMQLLCATSKALARIHIWQPLMLSWSDATVSEEYPVRGNMLDICNMSQIFTLLSMACQQLN